MTDFGIYVHWPYCSAKCPYCDFNSHVRSVFDETRWRDAILRELEWVRGAQEHSIPEVRSIFFGGGTPSLASGGAVGEIIDTIAGLWPVRDDVEVTLEANPASTESARFGDYRAAGVNRVSLGVQALNDADLKFLGRLHDVAAAKAALVVAMSVFDRVSLDLIYARPDQTRTAWRSELAQALDFGTEHLSLYQLTIEPNTPFALAARNGSIVVPGEDRASALFEITQEMTEAAGRPAYEISNHAVAGRACRHNLIYWRYGDYAGVGPGAHGRLSLEQGRVATFAERLPERWMEKVEREGNGYAEIVPIDNRDAAREQLLMNLRLREGLNLPAYESRWQTRLDRERIAELAKLGFVDFDGRKLATRPKGALVLNSIIAELAA